MVEVNTETIDITNRIERTYFIEWGRHSYSMNLFLLHSNQTDATSLDLCYTLTDLRGQEVTKDTITLPLAKRAGVWQKFGLITHEVNAKAPKPIYIVSPGLYQVRFYAVKPRDIRGIKLIGFLLE